MSMHEAGDNDRDDDRESREVAREDDPIDLSADRDERGTADEVLVRLVAETNLYHRGGRLVRIVLDASSDKVILRSPQTPRIVPLTLANLRETISAHVTFANFDRAVRVPDWCTRAIAERGDWPGLRRLRAVVDTPILRADGSITMAPGYDHATEIVVWPAGRFPAMPASPTHEDACRARDALLEVVCDFPFEREVHRAAWLAGLLTPLARYAFDGPAPLVAIDKNVRGAGGTLLADAIGIIVSGRPMPRMVAATDAAEERKRITAIALVGDKEVLIDNVAGTLGTDALDAALTGTTWNDRILGKNTMTGSLPLFVTWFATGNNLEFGADTLRRVMHVRLSSPHEKPEERTGFRHPDLLAWVKAERPRLVVAALTLLRAYCVAGRPDARLTPWGSYEAWSALVRGAVVWAGLPDPGLTREELTTSADGEKNAINDFLRGWRLMFGDVGGTIAEAIATLEKTKRDLCDEHHVMRDALAELCPSKPGTLPTTRAIGARLKRIRGRVVGGLALDVRGEKGNSGVRWVCRQVSAKSDSSDSSDSVSTPLRREVIQEPESSESLESLESLARRPTLTRSQAIARKARQARS